MDSAVVIPAQARVSCSSCQASIIYARTESGARMPVDADPAPGGTYRLRVGPSGVVHAEVVSAKLAFGQTGLRRSHFASCPHAGRHSRRRRR